jgi:hypothetical protein
MTAAVRGRFPGLLTFALAALAAAAAGGAVGCGNTPDGAVKDFAAAVKAKDGATCWSLLSASSKAGFDKAAAGLKEMLSKADQLPGPVKAGMVKMISEQTGLTEDEVKNIDGRALVNAGVRKTGLGGVKADAEVESVKVEGETATVTLKGGVPVPLVREGGTWKVNLIPPTPGRIGGAAALGGLDGSGK